MSSHRNRYIAIVDDDLSVRRSLGRLLRATGFEAINYPNAEAFLDEPARPPFDCLVLDIQLGGITGIELSRRLTAAGSKTPVIFITSFDDPEMRRQAIASGCAAFLHKTDSGEQLLSAIRRAIGGPDSPAQTEAKKEEPKP